jgi:hypothetical protein
MAVDEAGIPLASMTVVASEISASLLFPSEAIFPSTATIVSASAMGVDMSPVSTSPIFLMTVLPFGAATAGSNAIISSATPAGRNSS